MAPRSTTLPSAQTESARELARKFFCEMCGKGYARINEFEAHENSYDHQHRKRLKEMKALTRNPTAAVRDNRAEKKRKENSEMMSVNLQEVGGGGVGQRPSNATGFRDAMQVKSLPPTTTSGTGTGEAMKGFPEGRTQRQDEGTGRREGGEQQQQQQHQQQEKTMRPPLWDELDEFYTRVDVAGLPPQMLLDDKEDIQPWGRIWKDKNEMSKFLDAVDKEIHGLEGGEARVELKRSWDELSDGGDFDSDNDYQE